MSNKIYLIDLNGNHIIPVENDACIGREHLRNCEDKRISRKHAIFTIEAEKITITATHTNPLFYRTKSDNSLKSLLKNAIVELEESDEVGFLPDKFWFRISSTKLKDVGSDQVDDSETQELDLNENITEPIIEEAALPTIRIKNAAEINQLSSTSFSGEVGTSGESQKSKRPNWMLEQNYSVGSSSSAKKQKTTAAMEDEVESSISVRDIPEETKISVRDLPEDETANITDPNSSQPVVDSNNDVSGNEVPISNEANLDEDIKVADLPNSNNSPDDGNDVAEDEDIKVADLPSSNDSPDDGNDAASSSSPSIIALQLPKVTVKKEVKVEPADSSSTRNSCQFGIKCYRRNPAHLSELAHPGDSDYRRPNFPPAAASSPDCPYGNACYRRNPVHFQQFKHPPSTNPKRNRRKLRKNKLDSGDSQLSGSGIVTTKRDRKKILLDLDYGLSDDDESDPFEDSDDDAEYMPSDTDDDLPDTEDTPNDD